MKNVHMCYIGVTAGKIENLKKEGKIRISILIFIYTTGLEISENRHMPYITKFIGIHGENLIFSRNIKIFTCPAAWDTRKYERTSTIFEPCTIHFATWRCTQNFIVLNQVVAEKTLAKNVYMCYIGLSFSIFIFIYTIHLAYLKLYTKLENTGSNRSWEICDRNFHWRERKMNK